MKDENICDKSKTFRLPSFLVNKIENCIDIPKCKTNSDKYRYFLEAGVQAYEEFEKVCADPEYKNRVINELENIFMDGLIVENLMSMDASKIKGFSMAIDLVRGKRKI